MIIRPATELDQLRFYGLVDTSLRELRCAEVDGKVVAMCGLIRNPLFADSIFEEDGGWIGFLELAPGAEPLGWPAVVAMRQFLKTCREKITFQHDSQHPKAERLLTVLGLRPTGKVITDFSDPTRKNKLRIWEWQPSPQSQ